MPVITLEVLTASRASSGSSAAAEAAEACRDTSSSDAPYASTERDTQSAALYLNKINKFGGTPDSENSDDNRDQETTTENPKARSDLLEYMLRTDGSVVCKLCGEILQSRTHWYRHKYKRHVIQPLNPSPLFQCEQCLVFFKSRKGYIGHLASRHNEDVTDPNPAAARSECEAVPERLPPPPPPPPPPTPPEVKLEPPDAATPHATLPSHQPTLKHLNNKTDSRKSSRTKDHRSKEDWEEKRFQEEKLVADIIDRVKRECEAQGSGGGERRGYTRRTTVMHT